VRGYNRPSQGLRPLWRVEPDLERDRHARTQPNTTILSVVIALALRVPFSMNTDSLRPQCVVLRGLRISV
jgi:hypothetical protein